MAPESEEAMKVILRNLMEDYVIIKTEELMNSMNCCKCQQCKLDVVSYALNRLQPKYVATTQGELMSKLCEFDTQFEINTISVILKGIEIVSQKPNHDSPMDDPIIQ